jgi:hypothetical protein
MKLSKEKRDRIILICMLAVGLCFGLWHFVIKSRTAQITSERARLQQEEKQLAQARSWIERAHTIQADLERTTMELMEREDRLASPLDTFAWSRVLLEQARQEFPVDIVDVTRAQVGPMRVLPKFPYQAATFTVSGRAHFHDFGRFLAAFENHHPYFRVEIAELTRGSAAGSGLKRIDDSELLSFKIDIVALVRPTTPSNR